MYSSCTPEEDIQLSLDKTSVTLNVGETSQLKANISHVSDSKKGGPVLIWESSNTKVATVSNGMVTAVAPGEATISVRSGDSVANCSVTVQISVTSVALNASSLILIEGESSQLSASVHPSNAVNKELTWSSSNTSVAVVSSSGVVTAKIPGTATIKASTKVGNITATCEVIVKGVIVEVPDATFKSYLLSNFDTDGDGEIRRKEAEKIYKIDVNKMAISSLKGIEQMPNLYILYCYSNQLTELDVSNNTKLTYLSCGDNQLTHLDVSKNNGITSLWCRSNQLIQLDVSRNTILKDLNCDSNKLTELDVSSNTALTHLYCKDNELTHLDVSKNTELNYLNCDSNKLTELDVSNNTALTDLYCSDNQLTHLDVSKNDALMKLYCSPMNDSSGKNMLAILYIADDQTIYFITKNRSSNCIPIETAIRIYNAYSDTKGYEYVEMGDGLKWAVMNVGASRPEEYGNYYAWGEISPKSDYDWSTYKYGISSSSLTKYVTSSNYGVVDERTSLEENDDVASVIWGGSWRIPSDADWIWLILNCTWKWTTSYNGTEVSGYIITSNVSGYIGNSFFLPASGTRRRTSISGINDEGGYWSSSLSHSQLAYFLALSSSHVIKSSLSRVCGLSVRPVSE